MFLKRDSFPVPAQEENVTVAAQRPSHGIFKRQRSLSKMKI